jgi:hypothetical protein
MATITINIPVDKEDWVLDGFALRFGYPLQVPNPDYDNEVPIDPVTNPVTIDNPETLPAFTKRMIIHLIKSEANTGHNQASMEANAVVANTVDLT